MTDDARLALAEGRRLLDAGDPEAAVAILSGLAAHADREVAAEAWLLIGSARYRTDDERGALAAWQQVAGSSASISWLGWRSVAEQHVRDGKLDDAIAAYREADRRAPAAERGPIANRVAWLLKETGHDFAARRQFNRARGAYGSYAAYVIWALIAINIVVFVADLLIQVPSDSQFSGAGVGQLTVDGALIPPLVAQGEWWRLITHAFLHANLLHIGFNMYALYLIGPILEQIYGHVETFVIYMLCALGGGVLTVITDQQGYTVGASGAIFGLFGLGFAVWRFRRLVLNPQSRAILSQIGMLIVLNLVLTFAIPGISWTGHIGGLAVGVAIGLLVPPASGTSLAGMFRTPDGRSLQEKFPIALRIGIYALILVIEVGAVIWWVDQQTGGRFLR
ncbi:MAG TPA: rhomboid family intramembrane serine protease [Candidatus Limnocylindria bacterium]|nr:rhomboid family intramembrane serine protease [Candidatus Limnocylindria bacterium]